jgi:SAM-dependent methyltransferase
MSAAFPLDLDRTTYAYIERHNSVLIDLLETHVLSRDDNAQILDIGCGAGANARAIRKKHPSARIFGIEPNARAAELAREVMDEVFCGTCDAWLATEPTLEANAIVLSDVLEHIVDPVKFLQSLAAYPGAKNAAWVISVPNYAVWYNRALTLAGRFRYTWSGLYDRTHLRFFTRESVRELFEYVGLEVIEDRCTPSLVQSMAPALRKLFDKDVAQGNHLSLPESRAYRTYERFVEPIERRVCQAWPELLGFQIVSAVRVRRRPLMV